MTDPASPQWVGRYLTLLGEPEAPPSLPALTSLIRAQFRAVTFENVTSLLRRATKRALGYLSSELSGGGEP